MSQEHKSQVGGGAMLQHAESERHRRCPATDRVDHVGREEAAEVPLPQRQQTIREAQAHCR
jgi:hypothetical protein